MKNIAPNKKLIDLGCGNGRDSVFFCDCGLRVTAVDSSKEAIAAIDKAKSIFALCDDFVVTKALRYMDYDYCYSRWTIHAITKVQQNELLVNVYNALKKEGLFFIEARTIHDSKYGQGKCLGPDEYFFDNHYRRYINSDSLREELINIGFSIAYCEESDSFSVVGDDRPHLVRIIAKKGATSPISEESV